MHGEFGCSGVWHVRGSGVACRLGGFKCPLPACVVDALPAAETSTECGVELVTQVHPTAGVIFAHVDTLVWPNQPNSKIYFSACRRTLCPPKTLAHPHWHTLHRCPYVAQLAIVWPMQRSSFGSWGVGELQCHHG
jgi:hypothetical protein